MRYISVVLLSVVALTAAAIAVASVGIATGAVTSVDNSGKGAFSASGAYEMTLDETSAAVSYNKHVKIWMIRLYTSGEYKKKHGQGFSAQLFFSRDFAAAPGEYPIRFSYLNKENTLGGSFIVSGDDRVMFSHDTFGTVTFTAFNDRIEGNFEYKAYDRSEEPRKEVHVSGSFDLPRGDALR